MKLFKEDCRAWLIVGLATTHCTIDAVLLLIEYVLQWFGWTERKFSFRLLSESNSNSSNSIWNLVVHATIETLRRRLTMSFSTELIATIETFLKKFHLTSSLELCETKKLSPRQLSINLFLIRLPFRWLLEQKPKVFHSLDELVGAVADCTRSKLTFFLFPPEINRKTFRRVFDVRLEINARATRTATLIFVGLFASIFRCKLFLSLPATWRLMKDRASH